MDRGRPLFWWAPVVAVNILLIVGVQLFVQHNG